VISISKKIVETLGAYKPAVDMFSSRIASFPFA